MNLAQPTGCVLPNVVQRKGHFETNSYVFVNTSVMNLVPAKGVNGCIQAQIKRVMPRIHAQVTIILLTKRSENSSYKIKDAGKPRFRAFYVEEEAPLGLTLRESAWEKSS